MASAAHRQIIGGDGAHKLTVVARPALGSKSAALYYSHLLLYSFGVFYIVPLLVHYYSEALLSTALLLCLKQNRYRQLSEGLAQGLYMAARLGFEPATLRTQDTELNAKPSYPMLLLCLIWQRPWTAINFSTYETCT